MAELGSWSKNNEPARIAPQSRMWRIFLKKIDGQSERFAGFLIWGSLADLVVNPFSTGMAADRFLFENADVGEVAVLLVVVESVADHEFVGDLKADIISHCGGLAL
jgi:hypothetical protein